MKKSLALLTTLLTLGCLSGARAADLSIPEAPLAMPGDLVTLAVPLTGGAAGSCEQVVLSYTPPKGWTAISGERDLCLEGPDSALLALQVPPGTRAGDYPVALKLSGKDGALREVTGTVRVGEITDFSLIPPSAVQVYTGQAETYKVEIANLGNHPDTFLLEVTGATLFGQSATLRLEPGERRTFQVRLRPSLLANAAVIGITARSQSDPKLVLSRVIVLGPAGLAGGLENDELFRNRLVASLSASGSAEVLAAGNPWSLALAAGLSGRLSDSVGLSSSYGLVFSPSGVGNDTLLVRLNGPRWDTVFSASFLGGSAALRQVFQFDPFTYTGGLSYQNGDGGRFAAQAGVRGLGFSVDLEQQFPSLSRSFSDRLSAGYQTTLGPLAVGVGAGLTYQDGAEQPLSWDVSQSASYQNDTSSIQQSYSLSSQSLEQRLTVDAQTRALAPFGLSSSATLSLLEGQLYYALNGVATYQNDDGLSTSLSLGLNPFGVQGVWNLGYRLRLAGLTVALQNTLGFQDARVSESYGAGIETGIDDISVQAALGGNLSGINSYAAQVAYAPLEGVQLSASAAANQGTPDWTYTAKAAAGYQDGGWRLEGQYSQSWQADTVRSSVGAALSARISPELTVRSTYTLSSSGNQSLTLGADIALSTGFTTPSVVEELFGGTNIGRAEVSLYLDRNRNGKRDSEEPSVALPLTVAGRVRPLNPNGPLSLELREGDYTVNLAPEVSARYAFESLPPKVQVKARQTARLELPILEVVGIQGRVLVNNDGSEELSESNPGLGGLQVFISNAENTRSVSTDASGYFVLNGLEPGTYTIKVGESQDIAALEPLTLELKAGQNPPLLMFAGQPRPAETKQSFRVGDLSLDLQLPNTTLPGGAKVLLEAETSAPADSVELTVGDQKLALTSEDRLHWRGKIELPREGASVLLVQGLARVGDAQNDAQGLINLNPNASLSDFRFSPRRALSGQVLELELVSYAEPQKVEVHRPDGTVATLTQSEPNRWTGEIRAEDAPGDYSLSLWIDGVEVDRFDYSVLKVSGLTPDAPAQSQQPTEPAPTPPDQVEQPGDGTTATLYSISLILI